MFTLGPVMGDSILVFDVEETLCFLTCVDCTCAGEVHWSWVQRAISGVGCEVRGWGVMFVLGN